MNSVSQNTDSVYTSHRPGMRLRYIDSSVGACIFDKPVIMDKWVFRNVLLLARSHLVVENTYVRFSSN